ncbi:alpha/beta-hydrolase [Sistotremastrum niveocremeum HHB9708]|uniref:Alpha/beta-hydrolase n=1 Tax=Sistotremastrum niveocremeum HHB9708 TaxID=1314777 RepID=A0A165AD90_9AGAM|nr:alpha/beta-hydrolase [Sistotremastrum niveocremeum HHB9708]
MLTSQRIFAYLWSLLVFPYLAFASLDCHSLTIPVHVNVEVPLIDIPVPANQSVVTNILQEFLTITANFVEDHIIGTQTVDAHYQIFGQLCSPHGVGSGATLEIATHGVGLDHTYWALGGDNSPNNYAASAVNAGHSIFLYDRIGTGQSSKPDGIQQVQVGVEAEVTHELVEFFRAGHANVSYDRVVGVGHSLGSFITVAVTESHPGDFDDVVLTGIAIDNLPSVLIAGATIMPTIAAEVFPRYHGLPNSYWVFGGFPNYQILMVKFPFFSQALLGISFANEGVVTLGELITLLAPTMTTASAYTGRVLVVTGAEDFAFCNGDCSQIVTGTQTAVQAVQNLYPVASAFQTFVPENTGHSINMHNGAAAAYAVIESFIGA